MQTKATIYAYHGGNSAVTRIDPHQVAGDGELLCTSLSVNVARRYGSVITRFALNDVPTKTMSVSDWLNDVEPLKAIRKEGFLAVVVTGEKDRFDFPVDMVVALDVAALSFDCILSDDEMLALRDEFSDMHAPDGPAAVGWDIWLEDLGGEDVDDALEDLGWTVESGGACQVSVPDDKLWREYSVRVVEGLPSRYYLPGVPTSYWTIANNWGCDDATAPTRTEALCIADQWRRDEIQRRAAYLEDNRIPALTVEEDDFVPF